MSRQSRDELVNGVVVNGYDYDLQVWVVDTKIQPCSHPATMRTRTWCCNQNRYAGLYIADVPGHTSRAQRS